MRPPNGGFQGGVRIVTTVPPSLGELRPILSKLENDMDKEIFGLVSKRWLRLQSTERKKLAARAGPHMLQKMAARFSRLIELDFVSFYFKENKHRKGDRYNDRRSKERSRDRDRESSRDRDRGDSHDRGRDYDRRSRDHDRYNDRDRGYDREPERSHSYDSRSLRRSRSRSREHTRDYDRHRRYDRY